MKKTINCTLALIALIGLSACTQQSKNDHSSDSHSSVTSTSGVTTSHSNSQETKQQTNETHSVTDQSSSTSATHTNEKGETPIEALIDAFPNRKFPSDLSNKESNLNIAAADEESRFSILYYDMTTPLVLNAQQLNQETPFAHYEVNTYINDQEAKQAVNVVNDLNGGEVDLGHGIKGYTQGAAGSTYLSWKEGNWYLNVRASNLSNQNPVPEAKVIVEFLESNFLPAPNSVGQISVSMIANDYQANTVVWQEGMKVHTVTHKDPISALKMAVSLGK